MSVSDGVDLLATRVATEFNSVRGEIPANPVESTTISSIVTLTQAAYDALGTPDSATLYIISG